MCKIQGGFTALIQAAYNGHAECVFQLLECGADPDAKSNVRWKMMLCFVGFVYWLLIALANAVVSEYDDKTFAKTTTANSIHRSEIRR
jgi:hypothetical protein